MTTPAQPIPHPTNSDPDIGQNEAQNVLGDILAGLNVTVATTSAVALPIETLRDEDDFGDVQVIRQRSQISYGTFDDSTLRTEVSALKALHELGELSLSKRAPIQRSNIKLPKTGVVMETHLKVLKEEITISFEQLPNITDLTAQENLKLSKLLLSLIESNVNPSNVSTEADNYSKVNDLLHLLTSNFQRGVSEVEKLIERAKNREFFGECTDDDKTTVMDLLKEKLRQDKERKKDKTLPNDVQGVPKPSTIDYVQFAKSGTSAKKKTRGRKSIRQINDDLEKKIELYKTNQIEMEMFLKRIEKYQEDARMKATKDIIKKNKVQAKNWKPEIRTKLLAVELKEHEKHRMSVKANKSVIEEEDKVRRVTLIEKKEFQVGAVKNARKDKEEKERIQHQQQRWFMLAVIGSRLYTIEQFILYHEQIRAQLIQQNRCASIVQTAWRNHYRQKYEKKKIRAVDIISKAIMNYLPYHRLKMKHKGANIIRTFFQSSNGVSRLMNVIKRYRFNVITCQRAVRGHLEVRKARIHVLKLQWEQLEPIWWAQRTNNEPPPKATKAKKGKSVVVKKEDLVFRVSDDIKTKLLTENLLQRLKDYRVKNWEYRKRLAEWMSQYRMKVEMMKSILAGAKGQTDNENLLPRNVLNEIHVAGLEINPKTGYPKILTFKVSLTTEEVTQLIEKGFVDASEMKSTA